MAMSTTGYAYAPCVLVDDGDFVLIEIVNLKWLLFQNYDRKISQDS
ncbi:hypothetical protein [Nostoc sp.]